MKQALGLMLPDKTAAEKRRARSILAKLREAHPDARCALFHGDPYTLLAATILSAQCTDEQVNKVTPGLFARWPDAASMARADIPDIEKAVKSTGFFRNKARSLKAMSSALVEHHGGKVPRELEQLVKLPGVGRKTANVVRTEAWGLPGITVDTHVHRLSRRLGFSGKDDAVKIEADLMALVPEDDWSDLGITLIFHGRRVCHARKPECGRCVLKKLCPSVEEF